MNQSKNAAGRKSGTRVGRPQSKSLARGQSARTRVSRRGSTYEPGRVTREAIVLAAQSVLLEFGHARFTIERVATQLGTSPGNLNYYFPTKASLLETLIVFTLGEYRRRVRGAGERFNTGDRESLGDVLRWLMEDAVSDHTNRLFRELWALALNDPRIAKAMNAFYARSVRAHLRRLRDRADVSSDPQRLEAIVLFMHLLSEGSTVLFGLRPEARATFERVCDVAHEAFMTLLQPPKGK
jgi:AcrR family transcriptional regulator